MGIKIVLAKKYKKDLVGVLAIQHIEKGIKKQKRIGLSVKQIDFDNYFMKDANAFMPDKNFPNHKNLNNEINKAIISFLNEGTKRNINEIAFDDEVEDINLSYIDYFKNEIEKIMVPNTKSKHNDVLRTIKKYLIKNNKKDLLFREITPDWIDYFIVHLKEKGLANSSIVDYISIFRKVLNTAINKNKYSYKKNPFNGYEAIKKNSTPKEPLSDENIIKLINLKSDGSEKMDRIIYMKNMFLFQFFSNGMRMSDLFFIRWGDFTPEKLVYKMMKTDKNMEVYFNINICHILNDIMGTNNFYEEVITRTTMEIPINTYRVLNERGGGIKRVNIKECNELLNKLNVKKDNVSNETKGGDVGRFEYYNGYYYQHLLPLDYKEAIKEIIDLRLSLEERIELFYTKKTYSTIRQLNKDEFVFEKFIRDKHKGIFKKYSKEKEFTEAQFRKFKNLQGRYNYYLTRIENVFDFDIHLSSHIARHSFINSLLKSGKADLWDIMNLMGHGELRTSEKYINKHFQGKEKQYKLNKELTRSYQMRKIE